MTNGFHDNLCTVLDEVHQSLIGRAPQVASPSVWSEVRGGQTYMDYRIMYSCKTFCLLGVHRKWVWLTCQRSELVFV